MSNEFITGAEREGEKFNISDLEWSETRPVEFDALGVEIKPGFHPETLKAGRIVDTKYTSKEMQFEGSVYFLAGRDDTLETKSTTWRAINLYLGRQKKYVELTLEIEEDENSIVVEETVVRYDPEKKLLRGIGRWFALKAREFFQELSSLTGKPVTQRVHRSPGHGGVELSEEAWDRMFISQLENEGYERTSDSTFSKTFYPKNIESGL